MRVLLAAGCTGTAEGAAPGSWCTELADPAARAKQINATLAAVHAAGGLDGVGWDLEAISLADQPTVALFVKEFKAACPGCFQAFYIGNLQHRNGWEAPAMQKIAPSVDLVIVSAYAETNDTAAVGVGRLACSRPCGSTSLPTVQSALHDPVDGWANVIDKSKLVLALGWFHIQSLENMTHPSASIPAQSGRRISFCMAVALAKSRGLENRRFDNASSTWVFDCEHDAANETTFRGCGPWPGAAEPVTTEVWYDDAVSSDPKLAAIKAAEWRGVAFWQASGMWPGGNILGRRYDNASNVALYCKAEIAALWRAVQRYW
eukprot:SAG22_NODE_94_length_20824_cov_230.693718_14_plen_318_part_00